MSRAESKERTVTIKVTVTNRNRLNKLKGHADTFNHVIERLLDYYEKEEL